VGAGGVGSAGVGISSLQLAPVYLESQEQEHVPVLLLQLPCPLQSESSPPQQQPLNGKPLHIVRADDVFMHTPTSPFEGTGQNTQPASGGADEQAAQLLSFAHSGSLVSQASPTNRFWQWHLHVLGSQCGVGKAGERGVGGVGIGAAGERAMSLVGMVRPCMLPWPYIASCMPPPLGVKVSTQVP
jgi:hypothetical protein